MQTTRVRRPLPGITYRPPAEVDGLYASGAWMHATLGDALRDAARRHPEKPFLLGDGGAMSYGELDRASDRLGAALLGLGLQPGDRALFQMGTVPETVLALFACFKAHILPVCTLPQHRELEIGQLARLSRARGYFVQADFHPSFDGVGFARRMAAEAGVPYVVVARGGGGEGSLEALASGGDDAEARAVLEGVAPGPEDVAVFQLSGGSTGVPKIIPRVHGEYLAQGRDWGRLHAVGAADVCLWPLPLIHNAAMVLIVLPALVAGASIVLQDRFEIGAFLRAIERHRVTYAGSVGPIAPRLLDYEGLERHDLSSLRMFFGLDRAEAIEARVGVPACNMFGNTEGLLTSTPPDGPRAARHGTVGRPSSPFDEVRVLVPGSEEPAAPGEVGELCFRGPSTLRGYYDAPELNAESFTRDGFFRTGDLVRAEEIEGETAYVFSGRLKDNISRGNEKFAAEEVEALVVRHPAVLDAKVVAMPDRIFGEKACAFVIPRPGAPAPEVAELGAFLTAQGLAKYKCPERIEAVEAFPVTRVGKVDKRAMREIVQGKLRDEQVLAAARTGEAA